jgi:AraC-like DNA-binding protein
MNRQNLVLLFLLVSYLISAQQRISLIPDSLKKKNYDYLDDQIYALRNDSTKAAVYAYTYLIKAKKEKNWEQIIHAYKNLLHLSPDHIRIAYTDSMIATAKKSNNDALIGSAYLTKGALFYSQKRQYLALDNYLKANSFISKTKNQYLIHKVKYCIALAKFYIGFYYEAESLFKECVDFYKKNTEEPKSYINSIHSLGLCYNKVGNYSMCSQTNQFGISESKRLKTYDMIPYFEHSEGINDYFKKNFGESIRKIESALETISEKKDFTNEAIGNFYIGKSYWSLNKKEKAAEHFQIVDKIFIEKKYIRPDLRQTFELMINYYKTKKDLNKQLYYIDQLLKADTLLVETNKYILQKIHKQYDTKELILEKERIALEKEDIAKELVTEKHYDIIFSGIIFLLFLVILLLKFRYHNNISIYKKLIQEHDLLKNKPKKSSNRAPIKDINSETVATILKQLEKFENEKKFLDKDWNLITLSAAFNSNNKYLASIICYYRDKGFTEYINGLRIEYIISLLRTESKYKNYTYSALAQEAGFSTTERFTKAFLSSTGISPTFFIKQLKKENS